MPFVRTKLVKGIRYYYLVESYWADGKPHQRVLCYLGQHSTVQAAYDYWLAQVRVTRDTDGRKHAREMVKKLRQYL